MNVLTWVLAVSMMALAGCGGDDKADFDASDNGGALVDPTPDQGADSSEAPGWVLQESGGTAPINVIAAVNGTLAWTGDETVTSPEVIEGGFRRTLDGGASWNFVCETPENQSHVVVYAPSVLQIQFLNAQTGYALTRYSLLATSDGGATWVTRQNSLATTNTDMSFIDPSTGWLTSDKNGTVRKTSDGGATWTHLPVTGTDNSAAGRTIKFVGNLNGWVALRTESGGETVFKTVDGGITWTPSLFIEGDYDSLWIRDIATFGPSRAWVLGGTSGDKSGGDIIWATTDGGATWTQQMSDGSGGLRAVHFVDTLNGWAVGRKIHRTTDGGATWTVQPTEQEGFHDVVFVSPTTGWVVGENGVILKTTTKGVK